MKIGYLHFDSLKHMQAEIQKNNWQFSKTDEREGDDWTYGHTFKTHDVHIKALNHGRTTPTLVTHYKKIRSMIEKKIKVTRFFNEGVSCKRRRRFMDEGDEIDIDRLLCNSDNPWIVTTRDKKSKNIRIGINYALSHGNNEASFAKLCAAGAYLSDVLTKLGYSVEIIGLVSLLYSGKKDYDKVCISSKFKGSGQKLDVQRVLSIGLTGLFRNQIFGILEKKFLSYSSMGRQSMTSDEEKKQLNINYVIEQEIVKDDNKILEFFESIINKLVEKRNAKTWEWL